MKCYYCPTCDAMRNVKVEEKKETFPVRNENITIMSKVKLCTICGKDLFDEELDDLNIRNVYDAYRNKHGFLFPDQIKEMREKYGLSQRGFAKVLGWSQATIVRYEGGALPSSSHNEQLSMILNNPSYVKERIEKVRSQLSSLDKKRTDMSNTFDAIKIEKTSIEDFYKELENSIYNGFKKFDIEKLSNIAIYFAHNIEKLPKTKLMKLLWYTDFLYFNHFTLSISGTPYWHHHHGPVPMHHDVLLGYFCEAGYIDTVPVIYGPYEGEAITPIKHFDADIFDEDEMLTIQRIYSKFKDINASELSDKSHKERGYVETNYKEPISYEYASYLNL